MKRKTSSVYNRNWHYNERLIHAFVRS